MLEQSVITFVVVGVAALGAIAWAKKLDGERHGWLSWIPTVLALFLAVSLAIQLYGWRMALQIFGDMDPSMKATHLAKGISIALNGLALAMFPTALILIVLFVVWIRRR